MLTDLRWDIPPLRGMGGWIYQLGEGVSRSLSNLHFDNKKLGGHSEMIRIWRREIYSERSSMRFGRGGLMEEGTVQLL